MVERWRGVGLLSSGIDNPVTVVFWLMGVEGEVRLLRVVAVMVVEVEVRVVLNRREVCTTIAIIVRVWCSPYLALLGSSGRPVFLVGEAMRLVSPLTRPLLLLMGGHPSTLVREVTVVAPPTHVVMRMVAASLAAHLRADGRRGLIGCPGA